MDVSVQSQFFFLGNFVNELTVRPKGFTVRSKGNFDGVFLQQQFGEVLARSLVKPLEILLLWFELDQLPEYRQHQIVMKIREAHRTLGAVNQEQIDDALDDIG